MSDNCKICGDSGIVPYQKGIKCKEKLCPYWRQHQVNIGGCSKRFQYKRRCKLCVCVHSELQPRANTTSDKPEKICRNESRMDGREFIEYDEDPCGHTSTEYIRADLAKPSEWISVLDDLPEDARDIVAMGEGFSEIGFRSGVDTDPELWADFHFTVSHWCELPANKPPTRETP